MRSNFEGKDIEASLDRTVCRWNGLPVFVRCIGNGKLELYSLRDDTQLIEVIKHTDENFDISTPPLGYAQVRKFQVSYVTRTPLRRWKQGIHGDNIRSAPLPMSQFGHKGVNVMTKVFEDMIVGNYPPLSLAIQELVKNDAYGEKAISRECALAYNPKGIINVYFKNDPVGVIPNKEINKVRPTVLVPSIDLSRIITLYLKDFNWEVI